MGATTVNSEQVRSGQGALKEPGRVVFREGSYPKDSRLGTPSSKEAAYTKRESANLWPMVRSARIQGRLGWPASDPHRRELIPASTLPISRQVDRAQGAFLILNSWT